MQDIVRTGKTPTAQLAMFVCAERVQAYDRRVEPFAIAGRITFIYMKYGRQ